MEWNIKGHSQSEKNSNKKNKKEIDGIGGRFQSKGSSKGQNTVPRHFFL